MKKRKTTAKKNDHKECICLLCKKMKNKEGTGAAQINSKGNRSISTNNCRENFSLHLSLIKKKSNKKTGCTYKIKLTKSLAGKKETEKVGITVSKSMS